MLLNLFNYFTGNIIVINRCLLSHPFEAGLISGDIKNNRLGFDMGRNRPFAFMCLMPLLLPACLGWRYLLVFRIGRDRGIPYNSLYFFTIKIRPQRLLNSRPGIGGIGNKFFAPLPE